MTMKYRVFELGPIETNCYVLYTGDKAACIIDPVQAWPAMDRFIATEKLQVRSIIITHSHVDHAHAAANMARQYNVSVKMHGNAEQLRAFYRNSCLLLGFECNDLVRDYERVEEGDIISLGNEVMKVMHTPGHSPCSISLIAEELVVTGDVLFQDSVGRYDLPGASYQQLCGSLKRLAMLDEKLVVLPGHGPATDIGSERLHNEFILALQ